MRQIENELDGVQKEQAMVKENLAGLYQRVEHLENLIYTMFPSTSPKIMIGAKEVQSEVDSIGSQGRKNSPRGRSPR